jgi:hypothetical protein
VSFCATETTTFLADAITALYIFIYVVYIDIHKYKYLHIYVFITIYINIITKVKGCITVPLKHRHLPCKWHNVDIYIYIYKYKYIHTYMLAYICIFSIYILTFIHIYIHVSIFKYLGTEVNYCKTKTTTTFLANAITYVSTAIIIIINQVLKVCIRQFVGESYV